VSTSFVRWRILALLVGFSAISYIERINLSVAGRFIRDDFKLSDIQIGWAFSAFLIAYTIAQVPSGILADRWGPRRLLTAAAVSWFALTIALVLGLMQPGVTVAFVVLWLVSLRFLLGIAEAPTYPAATRVVASWFPSHERARANAIIQSASYAGSALTLPLMAGAVALWGWQVAVFASAAPALLLGIIWWRYARDFPAQHAGVKPPELALITTATTPAQNDTQPASMRAAALNANTLWLSASYLCHGYVLYLFFFWFYTYLVDERGFSIAASGWVAALPTIAAALAALAGGPVSDKLTLQGRGGVAQSRLILISALIGGVGLLIGALAGSAWLAIGGFILATATRGFVEASYWTMVINCSPKFAGTTGGVMNTASNLGGAISTAAAPYLVASFGWTAALLFAAAFTVLSGLLILNMPWCRRGDSNSHALRR
jgi:MFS transporter, ACS family, glucarate transporter